MSDIELSEYALRWSQLNGMCMAVPYSGTPFKTQPPSTWNLTDPYYFTAKHAPFILTPSPLPKQAYEEGLTLCKPFNSLIDCVSRDGQFLVEILRPAAETDDFTAHLLGIYERVGNGGTNWMLGVHRSDYMIHQSSNMLKQIEINTIASSFGALGTLTTQMHRSVLGRFSKSGDLPKNTAMEGIVNAFAEALKQYGHSDAVVLFVVQAGEGNVFDQRHLENMLFENHGIRAIRRTLTDLTTECTIKKDGSLYVSGKHIGLVYYRAGYTPNDYPSPSEWSVRESIERSHAIKCPSIAYQLAGAKKIQQTLAEAGIVERFGEARLRDCFAGLHALSDNTIDMALASPSEYVLKPQREGGGNNLYDADMVTTLKSLSEDERQAYILMERIKPPVRHSTPFVRDGNLVYDDAVSEFGVFGVFLGNGEQTVLNQVAGTLVRTKATKYADGGVAAGVAYLDSPSLI